MSLSRRQFLLSAGSEAARYAWALLLARIHEVLPLPCPSGWVRSLPTLEGIQSNQVKARRCRNLSGGFIRFLWPDLSAVADGSISPVQLSGAEPLLDFGASSA